MIGWSVKKIGISNVDYSDVSNKRAKTVPLHFHFSAQHGLIRYLHGTVSSEARSAEDGENF